MTQVCMVQRFGKPHCFTCGSSFNNGLEPVLSTMQRWPITLYTVRLSMCQGGSWVSDNPRLELRLECCSVS